ncbi:MAG: T9SS type A sorting domain-containing protein [Chitinophagaceae bacterium]|nr:T9SS type A sorting domain-containing protein [Chitinophagaceae bacterium]
MRTFFYLLLTFISPIAIAQQPTCLFDKNNTNEIPGLPYAGRLTEDSTTIYKIPVVVHVLHLRNPVGSQANPAEATIIETLDYLNKSFRAQWTGYPDTLNGGIDIRIEFVLATGDRNGKPFNGIDRIDASGNIGYRDSAKIGREILLSTMWDKFRYFNIWIVYAISGGGGGFAAWPEPANAPIFNYEGAVLTAAIFKPGNPIVVHEVGHYLGLHHTWHPAFGATACPVNNDCNNDGDLICDTEPHSEKISCDRIGTINPCTGQPYGNTLRNFMSYSLSSCFDRFTRMQKKRMREMISSLRPGVINNDLTRQEPFPLNEFDGFHIAPTPNNGSFKVYFVAPVSGQLTISIRSMAGQIVYQTTVAANGLRTLPLNLNSLQRGMYIVTVEEGATALTNKTIVL